MSSLALLLTLSLAATPAPVARGTVHYGGRDVALVDAVAMPFVSGMKEPVSVMAASLPIDRAEQAEDGRLDMLDRMRLQQVEGIVLIEFELRAGDDRGCITVRGVAGQTGPCGATFALTTFTPERVAGRVDWEKEGERIAFDFDLPVQSTLEPVVRGVPLPADGGAPGAALQAHFAALASGDLERIRASAHPDKRARMAQMPRADLDKALGLMRRMTPTATRITGGSVDADRAWVDFEGRQDDTALTGRAEMQRHDGRWYVVKTSTRQ